LENTDLSNGDELQYMSISMIRLWQLMWCNSYK